MLVLSRKKGESLLLGDNIKITILECSEDKISIGIEAPKSINIVRGELLEETIKTNLEAVISSPFSLENLKE